MAVADATSIGSGVSSRIPASGALSPVIVLKRAVPCPVSRSRNDPAARRRADLGGDDGHSWTVQSREHACSTPSSTDRAATEAGVETTHEKTRAAFVRRPKGVSHRVTPPILSFTKRGIDVDATG
jgi:hypothetical protein